MRSFQAEAMSVFLSVLVMSLTLTLGSMVWFQFDRMTSAQVPQHSTQRIPPQRHRLSTLLDPKSLLSAPQALQEVPLALGDFATGSGDVNVPQARGNVVADPDALLVHAACEIRIVTLTDDFADLHELFMRCA